MTPVLIYTDTERINDEKAVLNKVVTLYQSVYTAIKAIGVTATIAEINGLVQLKSRHNTTDFVKDYVTKKILDAASSYTVNGVPFTREAFKGFIALPDYSGINTALAAYFNTFSTDTPSARIALLSLTDDVISKVNDSDTQIEALFSYYTQTDASAQLANNLQTVCDALNTFDESNSDFFINQTPPGVAYTTGRGTGTVIPGLDIRNDAFVVNLDFIRKFEEMGSSTLFFKL